MHTEEEEWKIIYSGRGLRAHTQQHFSAPNISYSAEGVCTSVLFINPRRACARVTVVGLCVFVCLSVTTFSPTSRNKTAKKRYVRLHRYTSLILKLAIFVKVLLSKVMAWKSQQANKYVLTVTSYGADGGIFRQKFSKIEPFLVLSKSNGRLQASKAASY